MIQQRERLYDLCDTCIGNLVDQYCPPNTHVDDWDLSPARCRLDPTVAS
jgi:hypothetical protein